MINSEFYHKYKWSVCIEYRFSNQDMDEDIYFIDEDYPTREELVKGLANLFCKLKEENDNHKNFDGLTIIRTEIKFHGVLKQYDINEKFIEANKDK